MSRSQQGSAAQRRLVERRVVERLGDEAARTQDASGPRFDEERGLTRFRDVVDAGVIDQARPRRWMAASLVAALAIVVALVAWPRAALTLATRSGPDVTIAHWVDSPEPTVVGFSDGTEVWALGGSRWRVSETTPVGATLQLERGQLTADVQSLERAAWNIDRSPRTARKSC